MRARISPRCRGEVGQAAGIETIPLGILVFVSVTLLMVNAWAVVTNQSSADAIAREYLRAYTSARTRPEALAAGRQVAQLVTVDRGLQTGRVHITDPNTWGPCVVATVTVTLDVPEVKAPFLGGFGTSHLTVTHHDRVDAYRLGVASDTGRTDCDGQ